jgi:hypothetical protein
VSIPITLIIPLIGQLLTLSLKIADIIDRSDDINAEDKQAMKAAIKKANEGVTYWNEDGT